MEQAQLQDKRGKARILNNVNSPKDLKRLSRQQLKVLAQEIREKILEVVSKNGGHLGGPLGAVELTLAVHYIYNAPYDKIVIDTGHQSYPHKLITGRRDNFHTLRQYKGVCGFCNIEESNTMFLAQDMPQLQYQQPWALQKQGTSKMKNTKS